MTLTLTSPIWVTKTRLVLQYSADPSRKQYKGMVDALVQIYRYEGIPGLYRVRPTPLVDSLRFQGLRYRLRDVFLCDVLGGIPQEGNISQQISETRRRLLILDGGEFDFCPGVTRFLSSPRDSFRGCLARLTGRYNSWPTRSSRGIITSTEIWPQKQNW